MRNCSLWNTDLWYPGQVWYLIVYIPYLCRHSFFRHREEEPHNNHETRGRLTKQSNQLSLPQGDCKTRMDTNKRTTKHRTIKESHKGSINKQRSNNNNRTTALERTAASATGGSFNAFYWCQIFALDSADVEAQKCLARTEAS